MFFRDEEPGAAAEGPLGRLFQFLGGLLHLDGFGWRRGRSRCRRRWKGEAVTELKRVFRDEERGNEKKRGGGKDGGAIVICPEPGHMVDRALRRSMVWWVAANAAIA